MLSSIRELLKRAWGFAAQSQDTMPCDDMGRRIIEQTPEGYWVQEGDDGRKVYVEACRPPGAF